MYIVIFITTPNKKEASKIARSLLRKRLAACVNIVDKIESFFWWRGKIDKAKETLLIVKSHKSKFHRIVKLVKSIHSYEVPEIIALPVVSGEKRYLRWLNESIRKSA
jgi:periplasmic divalent cation tolerance protein